MTKLFLDQLHFDRWKMSLVISFSFITIVLLLQSKVLTKFFTFYFLKLYGKTIVLPCQEESELIIKFCLQYCNEELLNQAFSL